MTDAGTTVAAYKLAADLAAAEAAIEAATPEMQAFFEQGWWE